MYKTKKTDTFVTRDEVVSKLRGTTLIARLVLSEDEPEPLSPHAHAWQPEISSYPLTGMIRDSLPIRYKIELLNRQLRGELRQTMGKKVSSR